MYATDQKAKKKSSSSLQSYLATQTACRILSCSGNQMDVSGYQLLV